MIELKLIKEDKGDRKFVFRGVEFWVNNRNLIGWCSDWNIVDVLVKEGLAKIIFYPNCYNHTDYLLLDPDR
jgi:hypothetical protein